MRNVEELARMFHDEYERLAPSFGYETRTDTRQFDPESPNGRLMIAVCAAIAGALGSARIYGGDPAGSRDDSDHYSDEFQAERDLEDAERYRLLRRGQKWSVINGIGNELRAEELDAAIDAELSRKRDRTIARMQCGKCGWNFEVDAELRHGVKCPICKELDREKGG